ncbi:DUF4296 domain-containing protein [Flavobacterium sp. 5]|uniref:DUF4296 domain-containing protein n=1 Tax=Flavobacterium sp. 5 TaxID=2035199 RepID=UPI000C2C8DA6|nr:DUF4296 domain-containing protein [Flavobacterium sp. 5]PKB16336.1 uncharacterized protein DUF4296 [Flavobacterium sp. 5]
MKKIISLFILVAFFFSCNKDLVAKPDNLIDKKMMENIFYDMAILDALKYQEPNSMSKNGINPKTYIFEKYKIDSLQFVKSNAYYAADYREYRVLFDNVNKRLEKEKNAVDLINKNAEKKKIALNKVKVKKIRDSIKKVQKQRELKIKKEKDSVDKVKKEKSLLTKKEKDSISKVKKGKSIKAKK